MMNVVRTSNEGTRHLGRIRLRQSLLLKKQDGATRALRTASPKNPRGFTGSTEEVNKCE